jgi:plastocyanin
MATYIKQISSSSWRLFAMVDGFLTSIFVLGGCTQVVQPLYAAQAAAVKNGAKVSIANFVFTPGEITIAPGVTVTWANDDGAPHGLEYQDGAKGVDPLLPGASFTRRFDQPGTYEYHCSVHPYMTGRVVVRAQ